MRPQDSDDNIVTSCVRPQPMGESRAYDEVLAMIAHDLRNPLNTILLGVQRLGESRDDKVLVVIERAANRMQELIANLLDAQGMVDGCLVLARTPTRVRSVIDEVREIVAPQAAAKQLATEYQACDDIVDADRSRLIQVLANLIGNAIKFTPARGRVAVGASRVGDDIVFEIRDTGPGIPKDGLIHVFDRYWRATGTKPTGTGLGLYIAHRIVVAHGGALWVESELGAGSVFRFRMPCWDASARHAS